MMMLKDCEVEVRSEEDGFVGAWFKAVLEENPTKSGRKKIRIRYLTLLNEDGSSLLTETIDQSFIRPVPPVEEYNDIVLEEGVVVDADHKDGWWTGVVVKEMKQDKFLVYFDSPSDIIEFDKQQLRAHVDWTGSEWERPNIEILSKSEYCPGTTVEVSCVIDKVETTWVPAMIIEEIEEDGEKMFHVKECNKYLKCKGEDARSNKNVDPCRIRPVPPASSVAEFNLLESVEAFRGSSWRQGLVRAVLSDKRYMVSVGTTKEESVFKHADLRPLMEWEDGVWRKGSTKLQTVNETPYNSLKTKSMRSCSSGAKPTTPKSTAKRAKRSVSFEETGETLTKAETVAAAEKLGKKMAAAEMSDDTPSVIVPQAKPIAKESAASVTSSPEIAATPLKQPVAKTGGKTSPEKVVEQVRNQNGLEIDSTPQKMPEEEASEDKSRKRKREQEHNSDASETDETCNASNAEINNTIKNICNDGDVDDQPHSTLIERSPYHTPNMAKNAAAVTRVEETQQGEDTVMILPFAKTSPYWETCESMAAFKSIPQRPHFTPLIEGAKEDLREWSAVGMMVTFYGLLDKVKDLKLEDPPSKLHSLSDSFAELMKHGFDVEAPELRVNKVLSLQNDQRKNTEEKKCLEKKIEEEENETRKVEEELAELKLRMLELQRLEAVAKEKKQAGDEKMVEMKSTVGMIEQKLEEVEIEFGKTVSAPW